MPQAIWSGTISFGLVNVPVRLYPATRRKDVRFHELDRLTGERLRHQRVRPSEIGPPPSAPEPAARFEPATGLSGRPPAPGRAVEPVAASRVVGPRDEAPAAVPAAEVVKGFEVSKNQYVTVDRDELAELAPEPTRAIDVEQFVDAADVDPIYFDASYYAVPNRDHARSFGLLVEAMRETKKIAIAWFVLRRKRYLAALRPQGNLMVVSTMFHADEVLPRSELEPPAPKDLTKKEREMAALLINTLSGPFEPERYPDEYRQKLLALLEGRAGKARAGSAPVPTGAGVQDLMAALQASVEQVRQQRKARPNRPVPKGKRRTA